MLFYNENDEICLKNTDGTYVVLYDHQYNYFELNGEWYNYTHGYFYNANECDSVLDTYLDRRTHPRHMNIAVTDDLEILKTKQATFTLYRDKSDDDILEWLEQCHDEFYQQKLKFVQYSQDLLEDSPSEEFTLEVDVKVKLIREVD